MAGMGFRQTLWTANHGRIQGGRHRFTQKMTFKKSIRKNASHRNEIYENQRTKFAKAGQSLLSISCGTTGSNKSKGHFHAGRCGGNAPASFGAFVPPAATFSAKASARLHTSKNCWRKREFCTNLKPETPWKLKRRQPTGSEQSWQCPPLFPSLPRRRLLTVWSCSYPLFWAQFPYFIYLLSYIIYLIILLQRTISTKNDKKCVFYCLPSLNCRNTLWISIGIKCMI